MRTMTVTSILLILAGAALAGPVFTITPMDAGPDKWYEGPTGFETAVPPLGWTASSTNPDSRWIQYGAQPYEGNYCAAVLMDIMGAPVDAWLGFNYSYTANQYLHFALKGQTSVTATLRLYVGEDLVFDMANDWTLPADQWGLVEVDLSTTNYAGFPNVAFDWVYTGTFAPSIYLDAVGITEETVAAEVAEWGAVKSIFR